jgi:hypothetical protein
MNNYRTITDADEQMLDKLLYKLDENPVKVIVNDAFSVLDELSKTQPRYQNIDVYIKGAQDCDDLFIKSFWALTGFMRYLDLYWQAQREMLEEIKEPLDRIQEFLQNCITKEANASLDNLEYA